MTTLEHMIEFCTECGAELEIGQIGICELCAESHPADDAEEDDAEDD